MQKFSHVVAAPGGGSIAVRLSCDEDFLVVGFDARFRSSFASGTDGSGNAVPGLVTSQARPWRPAYQLDASGLEEGSLSTSRILDGRGVAIGGFDGVEYAQFARPGESLVLHAQDGVNQPFRFIFILTYSAATPRCVVEDFSDLL